MSHLWHFRRHRGHPFPELVGVHSDVECTTGGTSRLVMPEVEAHPAMEEIRFRSVTGSRSCADLALRQPELLGPEPLLQALELIASQSSSDLAEHLVQPGSPEGDGRAVTEPGADILGLTGTDVATLLDRRPELLRDSRYGLASVISGSSRRSHGGSAVDVLSWPGDLRPDDLRGDDSGPASAARMVGELLEILSLNELYKAAAHPSLVRTIDALLVSVEHPHEIRRTWFSHLVRTQRATPGQVTAQLRAVHRAEQHLRAVWPGADAGPVRPQMRGAT